MNEQQLRIGKIVVIVTWLFAGASFFFPFYYWPTGPLMRAIFGILAAVHLVEFFVYLKTFRATGDSLLRHFVRTITYGVIHYTEVKQQLAAAEEQPAAS
jgi:uncharacterized protein YhhL (DUF1145 family)